MKHTSLVSSLTVAVVVAAATVSARPAAAGPRPFAVAGQDNKAKPDAPATVAEYGLGAGDKLRIEVYKDQQPSQSVQVRPDGRITLPLIGDLDATGRTPIELRVDIESPEEDWRACGTVLPRIDAGDVRRRPPEVAAAAGRPLRHV
jgi:protein involved in polysaccharide export with SLBB domain